VRGAPPLFTLVPVLVCAVDATTVAHFLLPFMLPIFAGNLWHVLMAIRRCPVTLVKASDKGVRFYDMAPDGMLDSAAATAPSDTG
jgi:hypothetical protein